MSINNEASESRFEQQRRTASKKTKPMKRRAVLRSLMSIPAAVAIPGKVFSQQIEEKTAVRDKSVLAGPPVIARGPSETPVTPVTRADAVADMMVRTFNAEQFSALSKLSELVAPSQEDVPGAREGDVPEFLDFLIGDSPQDTIHLYRQGLDRLNAEARRRYGKPFGDIGPNDAQPILSSLNQPWEFNDPSESFPKFLRTARGDIIKATLNSRSYIAAVSQLRRSRQGSGLYWYPIE